MTSITLGDISITGIIVNGQVGLWSCARAFQVTSAVTMRIGYNTGLVIILIFIVKCIGKLS